MNLRQIEAFRTVMLAGSVSAAAGLLRLTQPTISKLIAQLERETKLKLFDRVRGRLVPRREAQALLQDVEKVTQALDEVGRSIRHLSRGSSGHLRVASHPSIGIGFLPKAIAAFIATRPDLRVTLHVRESSYVKEWVASQAADIGFVSDDSPEAIGTVTTRFQDRPGAICVLPADHVLAAKRHLSPRDLEGERIVSMGRDPTFRYLIDRAFVDAGVERKITVETNNFTTACALVAAGAGISVVDPYSALAFHEKDRIILRPFHPEIDFVVNLIRPSAQPLPRVVEEFLSHVADEKKAMDKALRAACRSEFR